MRGEWSRRATGRSTAVVGGLFLLALVSSSGAAQERKGEELFARALFDPQLVLRHARDIGLSEEQRRTILSELKRAQVELAPLQIDMAEPSLDLVDLLDRPRVDEAAALDKTDQVLRIENQVKKRQMVLLIRIKNTLTGDQQAALRRLRDGSDRSGSDGDAPMGSREGSGGDR